MLDWYRKCTTVVRCDVGRTKDIKVEVGLHHGSALSLFLFPLVMNRLTDDVRQESKWRMMFASVVRVDSS